MPCNLVAAVWQMCPVCQLVPSCPVSLLQTQLRNMRWGILPASAERRLANTSCFDRQKRRLMWRVEWRFEAASFTAVDECAFPVAVAAQLPASDVNNGPAAVRQVVAGSVMAGDIRSGVKWRMLSWYPHPWRSRPVAFQVCG